MAWDSSRPVPWRRLMREWVIYALIMTALMVVLFRGAGIAGAVAGILVSGPLYLGFGALLAKFGYRRKTLRELREERAAGEGDRSRSGSSSAAATSTGDRGRPAPTKRTSTGSNRPKRKRR
jgi:hypothetical protein